MPWSFFIAPNTALARARNAHAICPDGFCLYPQPKAAGKWLKYVRKSSYAVAAYAEFRYFENLERIRKLCTYAGTSVRENNGFFYIGCWGVSTNIEEYYLIMAEMEKPEYQEMLALLRTHT